MKKSLMRKIAVLMMALAVVITYSVAPMNQSFAASSKRPAKVKSVKAVALQDSQTSIKITWKKVKNAKKYQVYRATKKKGKYKKIATTKERTYINKNLKDGKKYYYKVRAVNGKKKGAFSKIKSAKAKYVAAPKVKEVPATLGDLREREMTVSIDMSKEAYLNKEVRVWVPVPQNDQYQTISNVWYSAEDATEAGITTEAANGNKMLYLKWAANVPAEKRKATLRFDAARYEVSRSNLKEDATAAISDEAKAYINKESDYVKVNAPIVKEYAAQATAGKTGTLERTRAIYDWVINNLERIDDNETLTLADGTTHTYAVDGCGYGDTAAILNDLKTLGRAGGHCTDINSTFVALCRASGIPAREMFGIRIGKEEDTAKLPEKCSTYQHCWTEFYLPGTGWVYADPGDVLKAVKNNRKGMTIDEVKAAKAAADRDVFWGKVDNNRIVLSRGRDITFNPAQSWGKCNTFGYPSAEVGGERLPSFAKPGEFDYTITSCPSVDFSKLDKTSEKWASYGINYSDLNYAGDYVIDVRPAGTEYFPAGHIVGSEHFPVPADYTEVDKAGLKALYDKAEGKRVVIVCVSGKTLAGNAMQALKMQGADMSKVTYLIGGATGLAKGINKDYVLNLGIHEDGISEGDVILDVRNDDYYYAGHFKYSKRAVIQGSSADAVWEDLDNAYNAVGDGKKLVIVCVSGHGLAKQAMAFYQQNGYDLKKITYLIDGANGVSEETKANPDKWEKDLS